MINNYKCAGIALPVFSLPSRYGIGTLGKGAREFIDFLSASGFSYWSILPLVPTAYLDSPYQSFSSRALNPYFIDFEDLIQKGLLKKKDLLPFDWGKDPRHIDYGKIYRNRRKVLRIAFKRFIRGQGDYQRGYIHFLRQNDFQDYSCFMSLKEKNSDKAWSDYDPPYNEYSASQFREVKHLNKFEVEFNIWTQYIFLHQWASLRDYAHSKGIKIIGEMPMYVSYDSIDVYKHHRNFELNAQHKMESVAGYPQDVFHATGQVWGNPLYNYDYLKKNNYRFIQERLDFNLSLYDVVILSSFRCIMEYYALPKDAQNGLNGVWRKGPGADLLTSVGIDGNRVVAEDVGFQSPELKNLLYQFRIPDMRVVEFAFPENGNDFNNPSNYSYPCYSFSTTHDCDTLVGYFHSLTPETRAKAMETMEKTCYLLGIKPSDGSDKDCARAVLEMNLASNSKVAIQSMNDILLQDSSSRINTPSSIANNWTYRITEDDLSNDLIKSLKALNARYGRLKPDTD